MHKPTLILLMASLAALMPVGGRSSARAADVVADATPPASGDVDFPDVYLNDSLEAVESITQARALAESGQWAKAARLMDRVSAEHGEALARIDRGSYESVVSRVRAELCRWPPEGLAQYRNVVDVAAARVLADTTRDKRFSDVLRGFEAYYCSSSGLAFGDAAAQMAIEAGELHLAARVYRRLLADHPERHKHSSELKARLAIVHALDGEWADADALLAPTDEDQGNVALPWKGMVRPIRGIMEDIRANSRDVATPRETGDWPMFAGSPSRTGIATSAPDRLATLWRYDAFGAGSPTTHASTTQSFGYQRPEEPARALGLNPVYAAGLAFVHDAMRIWAFEADSGRVVWSFSDADTRTDTTEFGDQGVPPWYAATYACGRLYVRLGSSEIRPFDSEDEPSGPVSLVCFEAGTGREIWRHKASSLDADFTHLDYDGAPLVVDDKLFAVVRKRRVFGFEDCMLACLDADTGEFQWQVHLSSASTGGFGYRRPTMAIPAGDTGTVFVATNLGSVVAVSAHTGRVQWLRLYGRSTQEVDGNSSAPRVGPWQYNPVFIDGDTLVCMPTDIPRVLIMDKRDGRIRREVSTADLAGAECLIGVAHGRLYGVGRAVFACDLATGNLVWSTMLPGEARLFGRGLLTSRAVLVPTERGICAFDLDHGASVEFPWDRPGDGGNLLVAADRLLVAGVKSISAYADKEKIWAEMRARMAARSDAPEPALDFAEIAFRGGDVTQAVAALTVAVDRAGGPAAIVDPEFKRRVFEDCLAFADVLAGRDRGNGEESVNEESAATRLRLLGYASQCPPDESGHIRYRLRLAKLHETLGEPRRAVDLYQQIIADASLRREPYEGDAAPDTRVGEVCRGRIDDLIRMHGPVVYAEHEQRAAEQVEMARAASDLNALDQLIGAFPNAQAISSAHDARGYILRVRGRYTLAAEAFYQAYTTAAHATDSAVRAGMLAHLTDCHRQAGRVELAQQWADRAAREYPGIRPLLDARSVTWAELGAAPSSASATEEYSWPSSRQYTHEFAADAALLTIAEDTGSPTPWPTFYVHSDGGLLAFDTITGKPVWSVPAACPRRPRLLMTAGDRVVFATPHQVFACDSTTGQRVWTVGETPEGWDDPDADHEDFAMIRYYASHGGRLAGFRDDGLAECWDISSGNAFWTGRVDIRPTGSPAFGPGSIAYPARRNGRPVCVLLDAISGERRHVLDLERDVQIEQIATTPEGRVVILAGRMLQVFDPDTAERVWQVTFGKPVSANSLCVAFDGIYVSLDGQQVNKFSLSDGRLIWRSAPLIARGDRNARLTARDGLVFALSDDGAIAFDEIDGNTVLTPSLSPGSRRGPWFVTPRRLLLLEESMTGNNDRPVLTLHGFDYLDRAGNAPVGRDEILGEFEDLKNLMVGDGVVLIQDGRRVLGWSYAK